MTTPLKLADLLLKGETALAAMGVLLAQKVFVIDASAVERLTAAQLNALFGALPFDWSFSELAEVVDTATLSPTVAAQLSAWVQQRSSASVTVHVDNGVNEVFDETPAVQISGGIIHPIHALDRVIDEYRDYLRAEFRAKDAGLRASLERELDAPLFLAQETFYQAHRPFKSGARWRDLPLDPRIAKVMTQRAGMHAYLHQSDAIAHLLGPQSGPMVVTTGTGSGKTETFLLPVIQNAIEDAIRYKHPGLTAILVYPMNALANDQLDRIEAYLKEAGLAGTIDVRKYDRGTSQAERQEMRQNPPHILLTNYMMLEYLLVRPADRDQIFANHRCRFLVLDEVHTYRGTLGSNIALLIRRLGAHLGRARHDWRAEVPAVERPQRYPTLIPIGTSATIKSVEAGALTFAERRRLRDEAVQTFFSTLTGAPAPDIRVIGETLEELPPPPEATYAVHAGRVDAKQLAIGDPAAVHAALCTLSNQPSTMSLDDAAYRYRLLWDLNHLLVGAPRSLSQIVTQVHLDVSERAATSISDLRAEVESALVIGAALPEGTPSVLRLRAHRLLRGGWQFHRCINPACGKLYPMGEEQCAVCQSRTAPLYLCRSCGADYLRFVGDDPNDPTVAPLTPSAVFGTGSEWLLYEPARFDLTVGDDADDDGGDSAAPVGRGSQRVQTQMRGRPVEHGSFDPETCFFSRDPNELSMKVTLAPARTQCLCCGATLGSRSVLSPVALGTSAAVKVMAEGMVSALADAHRDQPDYDGKERLLVFSDSRQDAAHQARFIIFASRYDRMRRRVVQLLRDEGPLGLQRIVERLRVIAVTQRDNPYTEALNRRFLSEEEEQKIQAWEEAPLLDEIALNAGYRATIVNVGLVGVAYDRLQRYITDDGDALAESLDITPSQLVHVCRCVLDEIRTRGSLSRALLRYHPKHPGCPAYLRAADWERQVKQPQGYPLDKGNTIITYLERTEVPYGIRVHNAWRKPKAGGRGPSLQRIATHLLRRYGGRDATDALLVRLLEFLRDGGFLIPSTLFGAQDKYDLLQVNADVVRLYLAEQQHRYHCEVCSLPLIGAYADAPCPRCHGRAVIWLDSEVEANRAVKRINAAEAIPLIAREHTAQVPSDDRKDIEDQFKARNEIAKLNLLACSPTLEMGIDVGGLDAIVLRNVPPRPDNYAQRAGRAGRRTRVGLVLGYARNTPHDQYFYDKPGEMIAGEVPAPAVALGNRDVILRHLAAIAFGAAEPGLAGKMHAYVSGKGVPDQEAIDALIAGVQAQTGYALEMARVAWGNDILNLAGLTETDLRTHLERLPARIQDVIDRTVRQVLELRQALDTFAAELQGKRAGTHAADLIARLLGITDRQQTGQDADDRSAGYPLRRFAEFGLLPGYEFPSEPAALRLLGDVREEETISVGRRFGIAQFQPEAQVYARARRWKVIGLDTASPWNPRTEGTSWLYRVCRTCQLRYEADEPRCPRCSTSETGKSYPAAEYAGFVAIRDEGPILDEEERFATRNRVTGQPQWNVGAAGRWTTAPGWSLEWRRGESVRWINEGPTPAPTEREANLLLHNDAAGYRLCGSCGRLLNIVAPNADGKGGRRKVQSGKSDPFGHAESCVQRGSPPQPTAIVAEDQAETLRLVAILPATMSLPDVTAWGISLGYALRSGMRHCFMLDGPEIEFELEGPWTVDLNGMRYQRVALTFIDPSVGGSGYIPRIAEDFHLVAQHAIEHLDHPNCETACYRCLKSYQNQRYHDILNWPRIITDLHALAVEQPVHQPLSLADQDDPRPWLEAYSAGVGSPLELRFLRLFEQHGFYPEKQVPVSAGNGLVISIADFAVPESRLAIYIDGAAFHLGTNLRRDRAIRERLRAGTPPWHVVELRAADLSKGMALVDQLRELP